MPTKYARMMMTSRTFKKFTPPERDFPGALPGSAPGADFMSKAPWSSPV